MNKKVKVALISVLLGATIGVSAVAMSKCGGSYELTDFYLNTSGVTLTYEVGDTVSLEGLTMTAEYSDDSSETVELSAVKIFLGEEDITLNLSKITESEGEKTITIVYTTKYGEKSKQLKFTVTKEAVQKTALVTYGAPAFIAQHQDSINNATNDDTAANFESEFFKTDDTLYAVGADNAFKFIPNAYDDEMEVLDTVTAVSTVKLKVNDAYVTLAKTSVDGQDYVYEYKYENETYVVENAKKNEFDFNAVAIGKQFAVSVTPDTSVYELMMNDVRPVEFEFEVVDGYNVYTAMELAVMDNSNRNEWKALKAENGLTNVTTNGIILHNSLAVTTEHIPQEFTYTLEQSYNIVYKKGTTTGTPESFGLGRTFLWDDYWTKAENNGGVKECDYVNIFVRKIATGGSFNFYGNYYSLDLSALPLVASFDAGKTASQSYVSDSSTWYDTDFSNATFLHISGDDLTVGDDNETCVFKNLAVLGNGASEDLFVTSGTTGYKGNETLVYCGSLIFTKFQSIEIEMENVRTYKFYITFFCEYGVQKMSVKNAKCYDSASNAMYIWQSANVTVEGSYFQRAGGPLILIQHDGWDTPDAEKTMAQINISADCVMEAYVDGSEAWFQSVPGSGAVLANFRALDPIFNNAGNVINGYYNPNVPEEAQIKNPVGKSLYRANDGKMNMIVLLMSDGTDPQSAMGALDVQGSVTYGNTKLDRIKTTLVGAQVQGVLKNSNGSAPTFNIGDTVYYTDGTNVMKAIEPSATDIVELSVETQTTSTVAVNYGGLGLLLGLFDHVVVG